MTKLPKQKLVNPQLVNPQLVNPGLLKDRSRPVPSSVQSGPGNLSKEIIGYQETTGTRELAFDPKSGQAVKRTHLTKEKQCCGGEDSSRRGHQDISKVPIVVPVSRRMDGHPPLDAPESEHPHCILPKHYFDAFLARARSQTEENGTRSLFSIETWEGRQVISYDSIES